VLVTTAEGTTVDGDVLTAALATVEHPEWIAAASNRLLVPTQVDASTSDRSILVAGRMVGVDLTDGGPRVDRVVARQGRSLLPEDDGAGVVALDYHFAKYYDLPATGTLRLSGGREVSYVGQALSPPYFMITSGQASLLAEAGYAVMWASLQTAQQFAGKPNQVNEAGLRVAPGVDPAAVKSEVDVALARAMPDAALTVGLLEDERPYRVLFDDIDGDQRLYSIFALLVMVGAAFAAFNLTGRIVEAQRREIGIGMSLGVPSRRLAVRPLLVGFQIALGGVVLGILVGLLVGSFMGKAIESFFPLPVWQTPFEFGIFLGGAALGLVLTFVATLWPVWRAVRVTPLEAIQTGPRATRGGGLAPLLQRVPLPGNSLVQMPLRNVLRAPRRTVLTALGIAAAVATLIGVIGMVDSFVATVDRGEAELLRTSPDRLTVDLTDFALADGPELTAIGQVPGVGAAEPLLRVGGSLGEPGSTRFDVLLYLVDLDSPIWAPSAVEGDLGVARREPAVIISRKAAADLGVGPGDDVVLRYPVREGLSGYRFEERPVPVAAVHPNPYRFVVYLDRSQAALFNLEGVVNAAEVVPAAGTSPDELKRALFAQPGVASVQPVSDVITTIRDTIAKFLDVLNVVRFAVLLLALLIAFNSSSISSDERAREHATMFAYGVPPRAVLAMAIVESAVIGVVATVLGILAGLGLLNWMVNVMLPTTLPDLEVTAAVQTSTYVTAAVLGIVAVALAPVLTLRRLRRMDIPSTLRVVE